MKRYVREGLIDLMFYCKVLTIKCGLCCVLLLCVSFQVHLEIVGSNIPPCTWQVIEISALLKEFSLENC